MAVSVLGNGWDAYALPPVEIVAKSGMFDTEARMTPGAVEYFAPVRPASLSQDEAEAHAIRAEIERAALEVYRAYNVRDLARIDLIWDGAQARVFEVNVSPGMAESSLFPAACAAAGFRFRPCLTSWSTTRLLDSAEQGRQARRRSVFYSSAKRGVRATSLFRFASLFFCCIRLRHSTNRQPNNRALMFSYPGG